jgi:hypothetical protein
MSLYGIIEEVFAGTPPPGVPLLPFVVRITSVWMRDEQDGEEIEYEHSLALRIVEAEFAITLTNIRFHFDARLRKIFADVLLQNVLSEPITAKLQRSNTLFVDSSIRPVGADDWATYSYPILLTWNAPQANPGANGDPVAVH